MHKRKAYLPSIIGILVLLFGCQLRSLDASDRLDTAREEAVSVETRASANTEASAPANPSPAALAKEINDMKDLIDSQRRQIEKLQSAMEKQQEVLNKAMSAIEAKPQLEMASASAASAPWRSPLLPARRR